MASGDPRRSQGPSKGDNGRCPGTPTSSNVPEGGRGPSGGTRDDGEGPQPPPTSPRLAKNHHEDQGMMVRDPNHLQCPQSRTRAIRRDKRWCPRTQRDPRRSQGPSGGTQDDGEGPQPPPTSPREDKGHQEGRGTVVKDPNHLQRPQGRSRDIRRDTGRR